MPLHDLKSDENSKPFGNNQGYELKKISELQIAEQDFKLYVVHVQDYTGILL